MSDRALLWVGSALDDLRGFPDDARRAAGYELHRVQQGLMPTDFRSLKSIGHGVYEIRIHSRSEHRVVYIAKYEEGIYVLHAFTKRTRRTPRRDTAIAKRRLAAVKQQRKVS